MEGHVAHLDHYIAGQSCGAEPDEQSQTHRSEVTKQQITTQAKGQREQLLCLPCLAFGAGRHSRRRRRLLLLLSHLPCVLPPPLHRRTNDALRNRTRQAFLGRNSWTVRISEGEARSTRNNGVLPTYPRGFVLGGRSEGFHVGEDEDKMAFCYFF